MGSPPANAGATGSSPGVGGSHALRNSQSQAPHIPPQSPRATTTEPVCLHTEPMHPEHALCNKRSHCKEEPRYCRKEQPPIATTTESLCRAVKTQHCQRKKTYMCVSILYWSLSFWLTSVCIMDSSFIHLIRTDSNEFFLMAE